MKKNIRNLKLKQMFQSAINNVVVKFDRKYIKNFTSIMKMAAIQNNTSIEPADCVNIVAEVVSVPKSISNKHEYTGFWAGDIRAGDTVILSHLVIFDFELTASEDTPVYKNEVYYKTKEFFVADIRHIFAVIRDGIVRMQNGYVMVEEMQKPPLIILSQFTKRSISAASAVVSHIGKALTHQKRIDVEHGDTVFYNPNKIQLYQVNGKPFGILRQSDILGKKVASYEELTALN